MKVVFTFVLAMIMFSLSSCSYMNYKYKKHEYREMKVVDFFYVTAPTVAEEIEMIDRNLAIGNISSYDIIQFWSPPQGGGIYVIYRKDNDTKSIIDNR